MNEIRETLREIQADLTDIKIVQARMEENVAYHIKRSDQADEAIKILREQVEPLKRHVNQWAGVGKALAIAGVVVGIAATLLKLFT